MRTYTGDCNHTHLLGRIDRKIATDSLSEPFFIAMNCRLCDCMPTSGYLFLLFGCCLDMHSQPLRLAIHKSRQPSHDAEVTQVVLVTTQTGAVDSWRLHCPF